MKTVAGRAYPLGEYDGWMVTDARSPLCRLPGRIEGACAEATAMLRVFASAVQEDRVFELGGRMNFFLTCGDEANMQRAEEWFPGAVADLLARVNVPQPRVNYAAYENAFYDWLDSRDFSSTLNVDGQDSLTAQFLELKPKEENFIEVDKLPEFGYDADGNVGFDIVLTGTVDEQPVEKKTLVTFSPPFKVFLKPEHFF